MSVGIRVSPDSPESPRSLGGATPDDARPVGITEDELQQGGAEVVEHPTEAGMGSKVHRIAHRPGLQGRGPSLVAAGERAYRATHSVPVVTAASSAGNGVTPRPGAVGTGRWPSMSTNGSVMSVR